MSFYLRRNSTSQSHCCVHTAQRERSIHCYKNLLAYQAPISVIPVNNPSSLFSPHFLFNNLSLLMVCVHLIRLFALTAVLINDAISLVFECPILSGVMNMHTFLYMHTHRGDHNPHIVFILFLSLRILQNLISDHTF